MQMLTKSLPLKPVLAEQCAISVLRNHGDWLWCQLTHCLTSFSSGVMPLHC